MICFSNMQADEFFRLNSDSIPPFLRGYFEELLEQIKDLQSTNEGLEKNNELAWEQVEFARELIQQIDNFAKNTLTKRELREYNQLRENSYFEV